MDSFQNQSSFTCDLRIIRAKNIESIKSTRQLFVRCYLSTGTTNKIRLDTQEISPKSDLFWNRSFSLDCLGTQESIAMLMHGTVVFELRSRNNSVPLFGKIGGSELLGRAEIPWKSVLESPNMEILKWAVMIRQPKSKYCSRVNDGDVKPPAVEIEMKVQVPVMAADQTTRRRRKWDAECECMDCACNSTTCLDYELFALGAAFEAF